MEARRRFIRKWTTDPTLYLIVTGIFDWFDVLFSGDARECRRMPTFLQFFLHAVGTQRYSPHATENVQVQDVDKKAHQGEREGEDANEKFGRGVASPPRLSATRLQPQRTAAN